MFDNKQAISEGWDIFEVDNEAGQLKPQVQLQKCYDAEIFADDGDAWLFVRERAAEGSAYHQAALSLIKERSPAEYKSIMEYGL
jgi:hypothetical protein